MKEIERVTKCEIVLGRPLCDTLIMSILGFRFEFYKYSELAYYVNEYLKDVNKIIKIHPFGVCISQSIQFARASSHVADFNTHNKLLTQKLSVSKTSHNIF